MDSDDLGAAARAAAIILDRAYGKPSQSVDLTGTLTMGTILQKIRDTAPKP